ncbi:MAG: amidase [Cellvibrionaceae bacterium]
MSEADLTEYDIYHLSTLLRSKKISSVELMQACLAKIAKIDKSINAFVTVDPEAALNKAQELDGFAQKGRYAGALHGIPIAVKDNYMTADMPTTAGSKVQVEKTDRDAKVVAKLREAGAIIIGKTNMHEWAYGATNNLSHYGAVKNPWNLEHISGGSSGGSGAALAARLVPGALGSDTGGSIRIPSAACGVSGLKPTYGRVSRDGVLPLSWSLDVAGPMARSAKDLAVMFSAISDDDSTIFNKKENTFLHENKDVLKGLKIARITGDRLNYSNEVAKSFDDVLSLIESHQAEVSEVRIKDGYIGFASWDAILHSEATTYHQEVLDKCAGDYFSSTRVHLEAGRYVSATDYLKAQQFRGVFSKQFEEIFSKYQLIALPTLPVLAPKENQQAVCFGETEISAQDSMTYLAWVASLTGLPAVSIPCGFDNGLPIGLSLIGPPNSEMWLLNIAHAIQQVSQWHLQKPSL